LFGLKYNEIAYEYISKKMLKLSINLRMDNEKSYKPIIYKIYSNTLYTSILKKYIILVKYIFIFIKENK